jgi:protein-S-isoprenylcysteine O-methyltransferase Ste14
VFRENAFTSAIIKVAEDQRVIDSGPYRVVRHPMYAGAGLMMLAMPVALGSWLALPCVVAMLLAIVARLLAEERSLARELRGYDEYCRKVRFRLLPCIW